MSESTPPPPSFLPEPPGGERSSHPSQPPAWAEDSAAAAPPARLGRYLLGPLLGQGGMGRVHEAWDPFLKRVVALKILHRDHPEAMVRFLKEAELQARVHHPNICPIFEVDVSGDQPLIAMQRIFGPTLGEVEKIWKPEDAARVMAEAASAVHAAHLAGLVHRDLKPSNFMVETQVGGPERVFVLDFGLARDLLGDAGQLTFERSGTPAFMSPEQILGHHERIGPATDVYGLGATLFHLLTGHPPFEADSLGQRLNLPGGWTPPSLFEFRPELPADLNTIVQKCLEEDPGQRYASAFALEEDLRRWMAQEPIRARPVSGWERLLKWAHRNPTLVRTGATACLLILGLGTYTVWAHFQAQKRQALAQHFGQQTEALESLLRTAKLNPSHDIRPERKAVQAGMALLHGQMAELGGMARGPGLLAMGMGHLALGEWSKARTALQGAWDAGERSSSLALALGTALGELYQQGLEEARQSLGPQGWEARKKALRASFLQPALILLEPLKTEKAGEKDYLEALLAFHGGAPASAIQKARACKERNPTFHEAMVLEARAWIAKAQQEADEGQSELAEKSFKAGGEALRIALDARRSDPDLWVLEAYRCLAEAEVLEDRADQGNLEACFNAAREACHRALRLDPDHVPARVQAARAGFLHAQYTRDHGGDPGPLGVEALRWAQEVASLAPGYGAGFYWIGRTHLMLAVAEDRKNRCQPETLQKALKALHRAESLGWPSACPLANTYRLQAKTELRSGEDPTRSLQSGMIWARQALDTQVAKEPLYALSLLLLNLADGKAIKGQDPVPELKEAVSLCNRGYDQFHDGIFLYALVHSHYQMALHWRRERKDLGASLEAALGTARTAVALGPRHAILHLTLGLVEMLRVQDRLDRNQPLDPQPARKAFKTAIALNPTHVEAHLNLARLELLLAERHHSPAAFDQAKRALETASLLGPEAPEVASVHAKYFRQRAQLQGASAGKDLRQGLFMAKKALGLNPRLAHARAERGVLTLLKGRLEGSPPLCAMGLEDLRQAVGSDATLRRDYQGWFPAEPPLGKDRNAF